MSWRFENLSHEEILGRARGHVFSTGVDDSADMLCRANMSYGIAMTHCVQHELGLEPDATFVGAPDATVTRNEKRWKSGFGYGGKISWGPGDEKLIILNSMPNACGMLVGEMDKLPSMDMLLERLSDIMSEEDEVDGISMEWDFAIGNHFIDLYRCRPISPDDDSHLHYAFIIHGSVPELKGDNETKFGFGLYYHKSKILREMAEVMETPFGDAHILTGDSVSKYMELHKFAVELSQKKRLRAAKRLFDDFVEVANPVHQGLLSMNRIALGCQDSDQKTPKGLLPIALRSDLPAYLVRGKPNLKEETVEHLGFMKRAEKYDVMDRLLNANILPHGGGYHFPAILSVNRVVEDGRKSRFFVLDVATGHETEEVISNPRELEFTYRGRQVVNRSVSLGLCDVEVRLMPRLVVKI
ncbi:MAG: hypothetical protein JSW61_14065 [Candidatus Thorarchaeota archaeon]|nr:MAG: hypothetical protein JSW61_14065 [Candidatus Thorarchaeota archaeon]